MPTPAANLQTGGDAFDRLPLPPRLHETLTQLGYLTMTPIQAASLPLTLAGHDLIAQAKTGSGKTAAFALPLLTRLRLRAGPPPSAACAPAGGSERSERGGPYTSRRFAVQALVLCPTRELADQVCKEIRRLARFAANIKVLSLVGGSSMGLQLSSLEHGAHIVVGTPGRIMDHLARGSLRLDALATLVLDEADRMLDMGFFDDIVYVAERCPDKRQTLLFSATYPPGIAELAQRFLNRPQEVKLAEVHAAGKIRQRFYEVSHAERLPAVVALLRHYRPASTLAFCNTRQQCNALAELLQRQGIDALTLHGELEQRERDQVLIRFANRSCPVLVATDVAARGLDIADLEAVINVDVTPDPEIHTHRIGRTGRADADGWALSLYSPRDRRRIDAIAQACGIVPEWHGLDTLQGDETPLLSPMATLQMLGGRREKLRAGDILGALTAELAGTHRFTRDDVGRITVTDQATYIAVAREIADAAVHKLTTGGVKGRTVKVRRLGD